MSKLPAIQFYPADWRKDIKVQSLSFHDRGIWFELLMLMHESEERGKLVINGRPMQEKVIAQMLGIDARILAKSLKILRESSVIYQEKNGTYYNKRMVVDNEILRKKREAGKLGGNPVLTRTSDSDMVNQKDNHVDKQEDNHNEPKKGKWLTTMDNQKSKNLDKQNLTSSTSSSIAVSISTSPSGDNTGAPKILKKDETAEQPLFFASLKNIFINFYEKNFSARPTFSKGEEKTFGELVEKLLARMTATKTPTLEENAVQLFIYFLERAFEDEWLADHFLLSNLVKQFDAILDMGRKRGPGKKQVVHIPLEELFERYQAGQNVFQRITEEHYHEVNKTKYLKITTEVQAKAVTIRRKELQGSNRQQDVDLFHAYEKYPDENPGLDWDSEAYFPLCKRVAVMFYFAQTTTKSL